MAPSQKNRGSYINDEMQIPAVIWPPLKSYTTNFLLDYPGCHKTLLPGFDQSLVALLLA